MIYYNKHSIEEKEVFMDKLSRIQIGNQILSGLYDVYHSLSDEDLSMFFYAFLATDIGNDALTKTACFHHKLKPEDLIIHKKDIILEVLANGYGYLSYLRTFCELTNEEKQILNDLDSIPFSIPNLIAYFRDPANEIKMKILLNDYFVYETQDIDFVEGCRSYLYDEATEFYHKISHVIRYIEVADSLANLCFEVAEKYQELDDDDLYTLMSQEEEEEFDDSEEEEYEEEEENSTRLLETDTDLSELDDDIDPYELNKQIYKADLEKKELANRVLDFLETAYEDKCDVDDFIGYFMSYVYAFLLNVRENNHLTLEDEEMLRILTQKDMSFERVVETFYASIDYLFNGVDLFAQEYFERKGDIYSAREKYNGLFDTNLFQLLDPFYEKSRVENPATLIVNPIMTSLEQILEEIKQNNPNDYVGEIWQLLRNPEIDKSIFEKHGLDSANISVYQEFMMRLFARKFVESVISKPIGKFLSDEIHLYCDLVYPNENAKNIETLFDLGYFYFIPAYFDQKAKEIVQQKHAIYVLKNRNLLRNVVHIDPTCVGDSLYVKAVNESELFHLLETNGPRIMISLLEKLSNIEADIVIEFIREVVLSSYYYVKREQQPDTLGLSIIQKVEEDVESFVSSVSLNKELLEELLQRYLDSESKEEFSISYHEKLEQTPKIKQILYPNDIY